MRKGYALPRRSEQGPVRVGRSKLQVPVSQGSLDHARDRAEGEDGLRAGQRRRKTGLCEVQPADAPAEEAGGGGGCGDLRGQPVSLGLDDRKRFGRRTAVILLRYCSI